MVSGFKFQVSGFKFQVSGFMIIDKRLLDELSAQAKASPRLRQAYDLRNTPEDNSQRMLNRRTKQAQRHVINNYPGWIADMINENKCGVAVEPLKPEAFADGLIYLADHPEERKAMGENARRLAERDFDRDILGTQFVDFIESI